MSFQEKFNVSNSGLIEFPYFIFAKMVLKNFSTVLYRLWRGGFKKVAFTNFRPDRHILSRADGRSENLGLVMWGGAKSPPPLLLVLMVRVN